MALLFGRAEEMMNISVNYFEFEPIVQEMWFKDISYLGII